MLVNVNQRDTLLRYLNKFLENPTIINEGKEENYQDFDKKRIMGIQELKNMIDDFIQERTDLKEFKEKSEIKCREHAYWGFKGFGGQMQLNQYTNNIKDEKKEKILREVIIIPKDKEDACRKIDKFSKYLSDIRSNTENPRAVPWPVQHYLLSYLWEIQNHNIWPVYYRSSKKVLIDTGFRLDKDQTAGREYIEFIEITDEILKYYQSITKKQEKYPYWFVEHVLWQQFMRAGTVNKEQKSEKEKEIRNEIEEWIPSILKDLDELAHNKDTDWSRQEKLKPEKAFENKISYAFTVLGYETIKLGQGKGREPDGVAISKGFHGEDYAIIYDAKARENNYTIGTNDREISEYIRKKKEELRRRHINKVYFVIISSAFGEVGNKMSIREIYKNTHVPIMMLKAEDLLFIINNKLQNIDIDHTRLEDLFLESGEINKEKIVNLLGLR